MPPLQKSRHVTRTLAVAIGSVFVPLSPFVSSVSAAMLEEVLVTAQRREQSVQEVAASISAFTSDVLEMRVIDDIADLQFSVPNLISNGRGIGIRGIANQAAASTAEDGLGFHINDVYVNRPQFASSEYFDIERVEVLRGPQGTLYGRNTTGGVLNIHTRAPEDEFGGYVSVSLGDYSFQRYEGAINLPVSDTVRQRFAGLYNKRDGYTENIATGNDIDGRDSYELRSSTSFDFSDNFSADLVISYLKEDSDRQRETKGTCTKNAANGCSPLSAGFETPDVSGSIFQTLNLLFLGASVLPLGDYFADANNPADFRKVNIDMEPTFEIEQLGVSLEFNYDFEKYKLTSVTGYYDTQTDTFQDFDRFLTDVRLLRPVTFRANAKDVITTDRILSGRRDVSDNQQFTQEFRLSSDYQGAFNFLLGAFYFEEERSGKAMFTHPTLAAAQQAAGLPEEFESFNIESDPVESESIAFFGEGYFELNEQTLLTVGVRYTDDEKSIRTRQQFVTLADPAWIEADDDWQEFTGKVSIEHSITEDSLVYASISRGYKAGGLNPGGPVGGEAFDPEYIDSFEVGSKNMFLEGRLLANVSAFYYNYQDLQLGQVSETSAITTNGDATVMGAEVELQFAVTDSFSVDSGLAWLDLELDDFQSADEGDPNGEALGTIPALDADGNVRLTEDGLVVKNLDGNSLRAAPEFSVRIGAQYEFEVADGYTLTGRVDHFWQDDYYANEFNKPSDEIDAWEQTDVQLILRPDDANWYLKAFVKNALDNDDVTRRGQDGPIVGRFRSVNVLEPRTYGVELNLPF